MGLDERYAAPRRDQWGPTRKRAVVKRIARGGQGRRGDEIVTGSINESSDEIVRGREIPAQQIGQRVEGMSDERRQVGRVIGKQMRTRAPSFCASQSIANKALFIFRRSSWDRYQIESASVFLRAHLRNRWRVFKIQALTKSARSAFSRDVSSFRALPF